MPGAVELLQWLANNHFLPQAQVEELRPQFVAAAGQDDLVDELLRRSWLTSFQAGQIRAGHAATLVVGPFRLLDKVGEGAMGQVFKAWHTRLGKFVAVKMLHPNLLANAKVMDRFRQEMATAAQLEHPNIVLVQDAGEVGDRPYLVMDYCEGINLSELVKRHGPLPIHLACDYIRQAAAGLQHAAQRGVVHRDLKPSNLLLTAASADIKILDFGLARAASIPGPGRLTLIGNLLGSVDYVAPEQIENAQEADVRSDIYSLGCSLYYLLAGRPPFSGTTLLEKVSGRLLGQIPDVRDYRPEVSQALVDVLKRMMAQRAQDRYQSPAQLADALLPFRFPTAVPLAVSVPATEPPIPVAKVPAGTPSQTPAALPQAVPVEISLSTLLIAGAGVLGLVLLFALIGLLRANL